MKIQTSFQNILYNVVKKKSFVFFRLLISWITYFKVSWLYWIWNPLLPIYYYVTILRSGHNTTWACNSGTSVFSLSLDDVTSMMDSIVLVLHFCRDFFLTVKAILNFWVDILTVADFSCIFRGSLHNKEFLLQDFKMCLWRSIIAKH